MKHGSVVGCYQAAGFVDTLIFSEVICWLVTCSHKCSKSSSKSFFGPDTHMRARWAFSCFLSCRDAP